MKKRKNKKVFKEESLQPDITPYFANAAILVLMFVILAIHLWLGEPFHRALLDLDDQKYIGPLGAMSLWQYLSARLWEPNTLSFPVRDATFIGDFYLGNALGIQTFILTSTLIFCAYVYASWCLFKRFVSPAFALMLTVIVALHPLNVEVVQWVISRKHLLAAFFALLAVIITVDTKRQGGEVSAKTFSRVFLFYALSLLSHPPALLLPLWVIYMLWDQSKKNPAKLFSFVVASLVFAGVWIVFQSTHNKDYSTTTHANVAAMISNGALGLGRATWQVLVPIQQAVYFDPDQPHNILGLCMLLFVAFLLICKARRVRVDAGITWIAASALLFLPQLVFTFRRVDFIMADRFLFAPLPYLLLGATLCLRSPKEWSGIIAANRLGVFLGTIGLALTFCLISAKAVRLWRAEIPLFRHCVDETSSDRCWWHYSRELFKVGCFFVAEEYDRLAKALEKRAHDSTALYPPEGALILSICQATSSQGSIADRESDLSSLEKLGASSESLTFARNLLSIESGQVKNAYIRIVENFLKSQVDTQQLSVGILGIIAGQLQALCETPDPPGVNCQDVFSTYLAKYATNEIPNKAVTTGYVNTKTTFERQAPE